MRKGCFGRREWNYSHGDGGRVCCDSTSCKLQVAMIVRVVVALREDAVVGGEIAQTAVSAFLRMPCNINVFFVLG